MADRERGALLARPGTPADGDSRYASRHVAGKISSGTSTEPTNEEKTTEGEGETKAEPAADQDKEKAASGDNDTSSENGTIPSPEQVDQDAQQSDQANEPGEDKDEQARTRTTLRKAVRNQPPTAANLPGREPKRLKSGNPNLSMRRPLLQQRKRATLTKRTKTNESLLSSGHLTRTRCVQCRRDKTSP